MRTWLARWTWFPSLALFLGMMTLPAVSFGQEAQAPPAQQAKPPRVLEVRSNDSAHPGKAGLGDSVILTVEGLPAYLGDDQDACEDLILFLSEVPIPGSPPEACNASAGQVRFRLDRTADSDRSWHTLLAEPVSFTKKVEVSLGAKGRLSFPTEVKDFELEIVPPVEFVGYLIGLLLTILLSFRLAKTTTILRSRAPGQPTSQAPYSLSRFQLAFWSLLVIAAYLFIWLITEELDTITGSVLALLGIGSATALGATLIDQGKPAQASPAPAVETPPGTVAPPAVPAVSRGFLNDVLSDDQGISIHRFQLFAWTLVLGVIFCASVYNGLEMPQFSTTLLGLMGISSGTYLGFKVPEKTASP
jgi:hypothetical protein